MLIEHTFQWPAFWLLLSHNSLLFDRTPVPTYFRQITAVLTLSCRQYPCGTCMAPAGNCRTQACVFRKLVPCPVFRPQKHTRFGRVKVAKNMSFTCFQGWSWWRRNQNRFGLGKLCTFLLATGDTFQLWKCITKYWQWVKPAVVAWG